MKTILLLSILLNTFWITPLPYNSEPEPDPGPVLTDGASPSWFTLNGDVVIVNMMPGGRIIDVRPRTLCQDSDVYGAPGYEWTPLYSLPKGSEIVSHEIINGWVMFEPARYVHLSTLCE